MQWSVAAINDGRKEDMKNSQRPYPRVGVATLIEGGEFGGLLADKAFDSNTIIAEQRPAGSQDRNLPASPARTTTRHRRGNLQMASPDRKLLLQTQGVQTHRHAQRQNRPKLRRDDLHLRRRHQFQMNLNRP